MHIRRSIIDKYFFDIVVKFQIDSQEPNKLLILFAYESIYLGKDDFKIA